MPMVCPVCNASHGQRLQCPTCNVRLFYKTAHHSSESSLYDTSLGWQQTSWGRVFVGLLLSQGLYYGLRQLFTAGLLAVGSPEGDDVWQKIVGVALSQLLQAVGLFLGGMLAGAGQRRGFALGGLVGMWNGILFIVLHQCGFLPASQAWPFTPVALYGVPVLQTAFGAVGGFLGTLIWMPLPILAPPPGSRGAAPPRSGKKGFLAFTGPVAWCQVLIGAAVAAAGSTGANTILEFILEASEGKLTVESHWQARLVTWEITALAMFIGGVVAGAARYNYLKQGLVAGILAGMILVGKGLAGRTVLPEELIMVMAGATALGLVGGWFGGQLLPPAYRKALRRKRGSALY